MVPIMRLMLLIVITLFEPAHSLSQGCGMIVDTYKELVKITSNASSSDRKGVDENGTWILGSGGPELLETAAVQANLDTFSIGNVTYQRCLIGDDERKGSDGPTFDLRAICSQGDGAGIICSTFGLFRGQACNTTALCFDGISPGYYGFVFECKGIDQQYPNCAMNTCTNEGADTCYGLTTASGAQVTGTGSGARATKKLMHQEISIATLVVAIVSWVL